jgi:hypothetical protein
MPQRPNVRAHLREATTRLSLDLRFRLHPMAMPPHPGHQVRLHPMATQLRPDLRARPHPKLTPEPPVTRQAPQPPAPIAEAKRNPAAPAQVDIVTKDSTARIRMAPNSTIADVSQPSS